MRVTVMTETRGAAIINGAATVKAAKATAHKDTRDRLMTSNRARGGRCWEYPKDQLWIR